MCNLKLYCSPLTLKQSEIVYILKKLFVNKKHDLTEDTRQQQKVHPGFPSALYYSVGCLPDILGPQQ